MWRRRLRRLRSVLWNGRRSARLVSVWLATLGDGWCKRLLLLRRRRAPLLLRGTTPLLLRGTPLLVLRRILRGILAPRVLPLVWRRIALRWLLIALRWLLIAWGRLLITLGRLLARIALVRVALLVMAA